MTYPQNAPATEPQIAQLFSRALDLLDLLETAASADGTGGEFGPEFLSIQESRDHGCRLCHLLSPTANEPLELHVLDRALFMISELLIHDRFLRDEFSAYREFCTEARARKLNNQQEAAQ